jgi:uncharacterized repeat protein (TIGR01451 family)
VRGTRLTGLAAFWVVVAALVVAAPATFADRDFEKRFSKNVVGDIAMAANVLTTCRPTADSRGRPTNNCVRDRGGTSGNNNSYFTDFVDVDGPGNTTFNSSEAQLSLPADATVLFAGLYWGANTTTKEGAEGENAARNPEDKDRVLFDTPTSDGYLPLHATGPTSPPPLTWAVDDAEPLSETMPGSQIGAYQAFLNVTDLVRAPGGTYRVANVQAGTGKDRYAGWALVVAYESSSARSRNLTVFDGFETINSASGGQPPTVEDISVIGFETPPRGPVRAKLGFVTYEGDRSLDKDTATFNSQPLTDSEAGSGNNFFNSSIGFLGSDVTTKNPNQDNNLGFEADVVDGTGKLANGATSAVLKLSTTGDTYLPGVVWVTTDLYAPDVQTSKSVTDLNGGQVEPGDELQYTIAGSNRAGDEVDDAVGVTVVDPLPANTEFVPGSLRQTGGAGAGPRTDGEDDDAAEFEAGARKAVFRVGTGANATGGGRLNPGEGFEVRYRVRVAAGTPSGTTIVNQARVSFVEDTLKTPVEKQTNETRLTTVAPDLAIDKTFNAATLTYSFAVSNVGDGPTRGTVTVTDSSLAVFNFSSVGGDGWTCDSPTVMQPVRCTRSDSLAPGASWPPINAVLAAVVPVITDTVVVEGGGDVNQSNNSDTFRPAAPPQVPLAVEKQVAPDTVAPGEQVAYMITVSNRGGFAVDGVQLTDTIPAGLSVDSVEPLDQGTCDTTIACSIGSLPPLGSARVLVRATVGASAGPGALQNTARVSGPFPDPYPDDNEDTAIVNVRRTATLEASKELQGTPRAGGPVRWTVTVQNTGPHESTGGEFLDSLPAGVQNASASVPGGSCNAADGTLVCSLPPIAAGGRAEITVTGTLGRGRAGAQLFNGVEVQPDAFVPPGPLIGPPPPPSFPPAPAPPRVLPAPTSASTEPGDVVRPAADVGVVTVPTADPLPRRGTATWFVEISNGGPSRARNVTIRDRLPAGARFQGATGPGRCSARRRLVTCRLGDLRAGRSVRMRIRARLRSGPRARTLRNSIVVDANQADQADANNRDRVRSSLAPRLVLRKAVNARVAQRGDTLTYTLRLRNRGPGTARNVRLCDRPGRGLMLRRAPGGRMRRGAACWTIRRMARGSSVRRRVVASVISSGRPRLRNAATVRVQGTRTARASRAVRVIVGRPPSVTG